MYTLTHMHAYSLVVSVLTPYYSELGVITCVCVVLHSSCNNYIYTKS